jgi:hypothetical protein
MAEPPAGHDAVNTSALGGPDLTYAIASPDTFRQLRDRGWSWEEAENWITETLVRTLLPGL